MLMIESSDPPLQHVFYVCLEHNWVGNGFDKAIRDSKRTSVVWLVSARQEYNKYEWTFLKREHGAYYVQSRSTVYAIVGVNEKRCIVNGAGGMGTCPHRSPQGESAYLTEGQRALSSIVSSLMRSVTSRLLTTLLSSSSWVWWRIHCHTWHKKHTRCHVRGIIFRVNVAG